MSLWHIFHILSINIMYYLLGALQYVFEGLLVFTPFGIKSQFAQQYAEIIHHGNVFKKPTKHFEQQFPKTKKA